MKYKVDIRWTKRAGVTILEMLVVLAIIAMLTAVAAPQVMSYLGRAKSQTAEIEIDTLRSALQLFYIDMGRYPTSAEGLAVLLQAPSDADTTWSGPYVDSDAALIDPWSRDYLYQPSEDTNDGFVIQSLGRDGNAGGTGEDRDLSS